MKKHLLYTAIVVAFVSLSTEGIAQTRTPGVTKRQVNQQARIRQGVRSDELTRGEAIRLQAREARIRHNKSAAKADGVVTTRERAQLQRQENRASRAIYRQKHDAQQRN